MIRCYEIEKLLAAYADDELEAAEKDRVAGHLEGCVACQSALAATKAVRESVASLPRVRAPEKLLAGVVARLVTPSTCSEETLSAFLDDALTADERQKTSDHLGSCRTCSEALVALDDVAGRVRTLPRVKAPAHFLETVVAALDSPWRRASLRGRRAPPAQPFTLGQTARRFLAAAGVLALALGSLAFATPNTSSQPIVHGWVESSPPPLARVATAPLPEETIRKRPDPENTLVLVTDVLDGVPAKIDHIAHSAGFAALPEGPNAWALTGTPEAVRRISAELPAEDPAQLDVLVAPAMDRVLLRTGEVFTGTATETKDAVLLTTQASETLPDLATVGQGNGVEADYFELPGTPPDVNTAFQWASGKAPLLAHVEPTIDVSTTAFAIARTENVAIRWSGYLAAERAGTYTFELGSDDGARLELDGTPVCGADGNHAFQTAVGTAELTRGLHRLAVLFFNGGGPGACRLRLAEPGAALVQAPTRLLHDPASVERGRAVVQLSLSRRSVVRVEHAAHDPVTIHVVVKKRTD
ncbi:MAG TPA: zf-HC2 domain-containing protein [Planctomycetota bacterium]|nr:zf-HC2 domain-containing protein [Planctomycetota bacterium]